MVYNVVVKSYLPKFKRKVLKLRSLGKTYSEINSELNLNIPKGTMSGWCHDIKLPSNYTSKIIDINRNNLTKAREVAWKVNQTNRRQFLAELELNNLPVAKIIKDDSVGMIALAMLCLGEASKSKTKHHQFSLGSADPRIITIFLKLLKRFDGFDPAKIRCTVQCRADQNTVILEQYWRKITQIPKSLFYPTRIDPRTAGKPTTHLDYKGVLVIDYYNKKVQLTLESLADLVYNQLKIEGP